VNEIHLSPSILLCWEWSDWQWTFFSTVLLLLPLGCCLSICNSDFFDILVLGVLLFDPTSSAEPLTFMVNKISWRAAFIADVAGSESVEF